MGAGYGVPAVGDVQGRAVGISERGVRGGRPLKSMYIGLHARDNVAIVVRPEGAAAGDVLPGGLTVRERIPQSHKVALEDLSPGDAVVRYGHAIGYANRPIAAGSWVREE